MGIKLAKMQQKMQVTIKQQAHIKAYGIGPNMTCPIQSHIHVRKFAHACA